MTIDDRRYHTAKMSEITSEQTKRICKHMNEDHGISVYAMLLSAIAGSPDSSMKISNWELKSVSMTTMEISYVACDLKNGMCMPKSISIDFEPPLESAAEVRWVRLKVAAAFISFFHSLNAELFFTHSCRPRLVKLHHENLSPKFSLLITDSTCRVIVTTVLALGYFDMMGLETFLSDVENHAPEFFKNIIYLLFGSVESLFKGVQVSFKFAVVAHFLEACYVTHLCKNNLKMNLKSTLSWFLIVSMVGYPMTSTILDFVRVQAELKNKQKKL